MKEEKALIATLNGNAPALILNPAGSRGTVLVYHGLSASKEVQRKEMNWLVEAGFTAVGIDAPHHGERDDGYLSILGKMDEPHYSFIQIVREAISEIPAIFEYCKDRFHQNIGIAGISLGGFISFGAVIAEPRLSAAVPILGSPDWKALTGSTPSGAMQLLEQAPICFPDQFYPVALFAANAGKDVSVPPRPAREFIESLRTRYAEDPQRLKYVEYPESQHMMKEEDWIDLWQKIVSWFNKFLIQDTACTRERY